MGLSNKIFNIKNERDFTNTAIEIYHHQVKYIEIYRDYVNQLNWPEPKTIKDIPFLPIDFFKTHQIIDKNSKAEIEFKSSGTGGVRSSHFVQDLSIYQKSFDSAYKALIGLPSEQVILALLPNYIEQGESSLVYMVQSLIEQTNNSLSGFFLKDLDNLLSNYNKAVKENKQVIIFGVSYALLDLADKKPDLSNAVIIETGGMKGKRKELTKLELHSQLIDGLKCQNIFSEYGMTELLSQAYCKSDLIFKSPAWMRILVRDINDPFSYIIDEKTGGLNIIDLANINSCSFIATQDLGRKVDDGFQILGRFDQSDIRGCNLLVQ